MNGIGVKLSASLMCVSFRHLEATLKEMADSGIDMVHVDVMDGTFVPNFTLGPDVIRGVKEMSSLPIDVHLMSVTPERHLSTFLDCDIDYFSLHHETCLPISRSILQIKGHGVKAGVALSPATPILALEHILPVLDFVVLMMVEPGYAGQELLPFAFDKIAGMKAMAQRLNPGIEIEVDGNVSLEYAPRMIAAGATTLVVGSSAVFRKDLTIAAACKRLRSTLVRCAPDSDIGLGPH